VPAAVVAGIVALKARGAGPTGWGAGRAGAGAWSNFGQQCRAPLVTVAPRALAIGPIGQVGE